MMRAALNDESLTLRAMSVGMVALNDKAISMPAAACRLKTQ